MLSRTSALAVIVLVLVAVLAMLWATPAAPTPRPTTSGDGLNDIELYRLAVQHLHAGGPYYRVIHDLLVQGGFGTGSVFNWRTPLLLSAVAALPSLAWAQAILVALLLAILAALVPLLRRDGGLGLAVPGVLIVLISLATVFAQDAVLVSEVPAGMLMLLSATLYGLGRPHAGMAVGGAALFLRELSGLYVLFCVVQAVRHRRRRELLGWAIILMLYALYLGWHAYNVAFHTLPGDPHYASGWLAWGGLGFAGMTAGFSGLFLLLPASIGSMALPLALLGLWAWPGQAGRMIALLATGYTALFLVIGKPFNGYWGALYTPALSLGLCWAPWAVRDLARAIATGAARPIEPVKVN